MIADVSTGMGRLSGEAVRPLRTLDPAAPMDDLEWLDEAVGDARVVAIGESAHYNGEFYRLRHRLLRHLVERHGFGAYVMETGFVEGWRADAWVRGGEDDLGAVLASGMTSLMGLWAPMRAHLEWMRERNGAAARPVGFYGLDLPGSMVSLLPGLDAVAAYLGQADPEFRIGPEILETASAFPAPSAFSAPQALAAYAGLAQEARDALTAGLADLAARMRGRRLEYLRRTTADAYERALRSLEVTVAADSLVRQMLRGDRQGGMLTRDDAMADTVEWILRREERIVLAAHNGHVQRGPAALPGMPPVTPLGMHLGDRLGEDYLVVGTTSGTGHILNNGADFYTGTLFAELGPPRPGSLDALMDAAHDGPFATDLRRLSPSDAEAVRAAGEQRAGVGDFYAELSPLDAYDVVVHLPRVTAAAPDPGALACSPQEVRDTFARWTPPGP
ncbi:erythromycin esterase family protein [Microbispora corallina]|uniref:Erythromycin esterase n=1 Tax=Microbispora corallina TaxID=83302 RepID=A0ABQ4G7J6_9ACTN|nr:erythromycin esterase family protein [Microbispora corallina]GIH43054.1 erythromycin esterase [Microbispora corallina]